jgi:hypothetical protein
MPDDWMAVPMSFGLIMAGFAGVDNKKKEKRKDRSKLTVYIARRLSYHLS